MAQYYEDFMDRSGDLPDLIKSSTHQIQQLDEFAQGEHDCYLALFMQSFILFSR